MISIFNEIQYKKSNFLENYRFKAESLVICKVALKMLEEEIGQRSISRIAGLNIIPTNIIGTMELY